MNQEESQLTRGSICFISVDIYSNAVAVRKEHWKALQVSQESGNNVVCFHYRILLVKKTRPYRRARDALMTPRNRTTSPLRPAFARLRHHPFRLQHLLTPGRGASPWTCDFLRLGSITCLLVMLVSCPPYSACLSPSSLVLDQDQYQCHVYCCTWCHNYHSSWHSPAAVTGDTLSALSNAVPTATSEANSPQSQAPRQILYMPIPKHISVASKGIK